MSARIISTSTCGITFEDDCRANPWDSICVDAVLAAAQGSCEPAFSKVGKASPRGTPCGSRMVVTPARPLFSDNSGLVDICGSIHWVGVLISTGGNCLLGKIPVASFSIMCGPAYKPPFADGFGPDPPGSICGAAELGFGSRLRICFTTMLPPCGKDRVGVIG